MSAKTLLLIRRFSSGLSLIIDYLTEYYSCLYIFTAGQTGLSYEVYVPIIVIVVLIVVLVIVLVCLFRIRKQNKEKSKIHDSQEFLQSSGTHQGKPLVYLSMPV